MEELNIQRRLTSRRSQEEYHNECHKPGSKLEAGKRWGLHTQHVIFGSYQLNTGLPVELRLTCGILSLYYQAKQTTAMTSAGNKESRHSSSSFQLCVTVGRDVWDGFHFPISTDTWSTSASIHNTCITSAARAGPVATQVSFYGNRRVLRLFQSPVKISQASKQRWQDKHGDFTPSALKNFFQSSLLSLDIWWCTNSEGPWQMINASHSDCSSTPALIKLRWGVRGQVKPFCIPPLNSNRAPPVSLRGHPSPLWLTLFDNHCLWGHQQPCISLKGLFCCGTKWAHSKCEDHRENMRAKRGGEI